MVMDQQLNQSRRRVCACSWRWKVRYVVVFDIFLLLCWGFQWTELKIEVERVGRKERAEKEKEWRVRKYVCAMSGSVYECMCMARMGERG